MATVWRWPPDSEAIGSRTDGNAGRELVQQRPGPDLHRDLVEGVGAELASEENVGDDVEVLAEGQVLEHRRDAHGQRLARAREGHGLAEERHRAGGRGVDAGQNLDEGRLAGAVVADQGHDLAGASRRGRCR